MYFIESKEVSFDENSEMYIEDFFEEIDFDFFLEATGTKTFVMHDFLYDKIASVLSTPVGDAKFKKLVNAFVDRNIEKLNAEGPTKMVVFGEVDKNEFFHLFGLTSKEVSDKVKEMLKLISTKAQFKLLNGHPLFFVLYMCIRFYSLKKDVKGLNSALAIYALYVYPSIYTKYWKHKYARPEVMKYTIDNLTNKFIFKQQKHVFGALTFSIQNSYKFLKTSIEKDDCDTEIIRWIQRIRNDQNSMFKKLYDQYKKNYEAGLKVEIEKEEFDGNIVDDIYNNTSSVEFVTRKVVLPMITGGIDISRASAAARASGGVGISDTRLYLSRILVEARTEEVEKFVESILFLFLYDENKKPNDINTSYFLKWSLDLFRKTNSNNENIKTFKDLLDKWAEEIGVHDKFKREASRVNYKKAIFFYFIFSIQAYNN